MRILVAGAGATGGYFGGRMALAGRDITYLVHPARAEKLRRDGLRITGPDGRTDVVHPRVLTAAGLDGPYDAVLIAVKAAGLPSVVDDLCPAIGPDTLIVPFLNGLAHLRRLADAFGEKNLLGGVVQVVATLDDDGGVLQLTPLASLAVGELGAPAGERIRRLLEQFDVVGIDARASDDALAAMWHKWVFIVSAGVVTCLMRGPVGAIVSVPGGRAFVHRVLAETSGVAEAAGYPVPDAAYRQSLTMLTEPGSAFTSSLYRDVAAGLPNEAEHLVGDFADQARGVGVDTPLVDLALMQLRVHNAGA
jgi:2-dehydropantoate 2-reductase